MLKCFIQPTVYGTKIWTTILTLTTTWTNNSSSHWYVHWPRWNMTVTWIDCLHQHAHHHLTTMFINSFCLCFLQTTIMLVNNHNSSHPLQIWPIYQVRTFYVYCSNNRVLLLQVNNSNSNSHLHPWHLDQQHLLHSNNTWSLDPEFLQLAGFFPFLCRFCRISSIHV